MLELFAARVKQQSAAIAVECGQEALTYGELDRRANQLGHYLRRLGVGPEVRVGVWLPRSLDLVVALFGIIKAGGAYVPLDMNYPQDRVGFMLEDSQAHVLLTLEKLRNDLPGYAGRRVLLDAEEEAIARETEEPPNMGVGAENIAYLIYTSGSTGRPKAVAIRHHSVVILLHWTREIYTDEELGGVLASTSICFDMSVFEIFGTLSWGGRVIVVNNAVDWEAISAARGVTLIDTVPSAMAELVRMGAVPKSVRTVNLGGEALPTALVKQVYEIENVERVYNLYGPSEDTTFTSYELVRRDEQAAIAPVGLPLINTDFHILDRLMQPVSAGETGELYIGGDGLARGYLNRPELTAERFVPDGLSQRPGARLYYTGDRVRYLTDGRLEYLGRIDHQVKIRGHRIELGEIEATLNACPGVEQAVVTVWEDVPGQKRLVAYVVAGRENPDHAGQMRMQIQEKLPEYMVPSQFVMLEQMPLTPNGKINRHALPAPDVSEAAAGPETELERAMGRACCEVLGVASVSMDSTFMEMGGSSLNATRAVAAIREAIAMRVPITALLGVKTLREIVRDLEAQQNTAAESAGPRRLAERNGRIPAAYSQERIWFIQKMNPQNIAYHFAAKVRFIGRMNKAALAQALHKFIERHENYRTTLEETEGTLCQVIHNPWRVNLEEVDVENNSGRELEVFKELQKAFDLGALPLVRWKLLRVSDQEHVLLTVEHHAIHDGWSFNLFLGELIELYRSFDQGVPARIAPAPLQFADFALWQREWMETQEARDQLNYWTKVLANAPPVLPLAYDRPRPAFQTYEGGLLRFCIADELENALAAAVQRDRVTLFMVFATAAEILLYRYSRQEDFCIGTGVANRRWAAVKDMTGMVVNNLPLRVHIHGNMALAELMDRVRKATLEAYSFQDVPFDQIVQAINPVRDPSYNPIFQGMVAFHDSPLNCASLGGETHLIVEQALSNGSAKFDFDVIVIPPQNHNLPPGHKPRRELLWEYNSALFDRATAQQMAEHFIRVLEEIAGGKRRTVSEIELLSSPEREQLLFGWNQTTRPFPQPCVHQLFEEQAEKAPEAPALDYNGQRLTYGELNWQANQLAHYLKRLGIRPESLIGVYMERGPQIIVTLLAILKAGAAYVPLDLSYPPERLRFMIHDAGLQTVLADRGAGEELAAACSAMRWIDVSAEAYDIATESGLNPECTIDNRHVAYVMFTSGSTGKPKGIAIEHRNIVRLVRETEYLAPSDTERITQGSNVSFDAATFEIWGALLNGGCLVGIDKQTLVNPAELARKVRDHKLTTVWLTTALFNQVARQAPDAFAGTQAVMFGGEATDPQYVRAVLKNGAPGRLVNFYGPTETTTFATWFLIKEVEEGATSLPIGGPISNAQLYVLDEWLQPVPLGAAGELLIGGAGVGRGYLNRPGLTAEKFIPDPFSRQDGQRLFRSGDLVRRLRDGNLEFMSRVDDQVKVRGFRVELGEIETTLALMEGVKQCAVVLREDRPGEKKLAAYFVPENGVAVDPARLRVFLKSKLPEFMVPGAFVEVPEIPVNANGKVDRQALPAAHYGSGTYRSPRTPQEEMLCEIFADVLSAESVGIDENFFDLGGHSLMAMRLVNRIRSTLGVEVAVQKFFESPTVAGLAESMGKGAVSRIQIVRQQRPEHVPLSYTQKRLWFMESIASEVSLYNMPLAHTLKGKLDVLALEMSLNEIVRRHEILRTRFDEVQGHAIQIVEPEVRVRVEKEDLRTMTGEAQQKFLAMRLDEEARRPFDLHRVPLLRLWVFQTADDTHVLLFVVHHIIADGWSLEILYRDLEVFYAAFHAGEKPEAKELPLQYGDYAVWQRDMMGRGEFDDDLRYWTRKLAGAPAVLQMEADYDPPEQPTFVGITGRFELSEATTQALRQFSARSGATLHMTLLAAYGLLLHRASGQEDVLVGTPIANRSQQSFQDVIGFFVNILPLRIEFKGDPTFKELVQRVKATALEAYLHQELPFERLVEELKPEREIRRNPVFQAVFNMLTKDSSILHLPDMECSPLDLDINSGKFDLYLEIQEHQRRLRGRMICSSDLFAPRTVKDLCRRLERLITQAATAPEDQPASGLDLLLEDERLSLEATTSVQDLEELFRF